MQLHHLGTAALGASVLGFFAHWSATLQGIAAACAIVAYAISAYRAIKKK